MSGRIFDPERNENGNYETKTNRDPLNQFVEPGMEGNAREQETKYGGGGRPRADLCAYRHHKVETKRNTAETMVRTTNVLERNTKR